MRRNQTTAQKLWPQEQFVNRCSYLITALIPVLLYSLVQLLRVGSSGNHYVLMLAGSVLSALGIFGYVMASFVYGAANRKSFVAMLLTFGGFVPYLFGCYLTFYQGFWGFAELRYTSPLWAILKAAAAIVVGVIVVRQTYEVTELDKKVAEFAKETAADDQPHNGIR